MNKSYLCVVGKNIRTVLLMTDNKKINTILKKITNRKNNFDTKKNLFSQGLDSLDLTTFLLSLEDKFKIKFKSDAYDKLNSIQDISNYLKKNKK